VIAYRQAIRALRTCLKADDVDAIIYAGSEDLHAVAVKIGTELQNEEGKGEAVDRIMHYATVFDVLSQTNSQFGCLIWGLLRFVLIVRRPRQLLKLMVW
jgi:hypothetical protein